MLAKTCVAPLELAKLLMQVQDAQRGAGAAPGRACATASAPRFAHAFECVHYIAATHGPRALWAGHGATLSRYVPVQLFNCAFRPALSSLLVPAADGGAAPSGAAAVDSGSGGAARAAAERGRVARARWGAT